MTHDYKRALEYVQDKISQYNPYTKQNNFVGGLYKRCAENYEAIESALQHMLDKEKSAKYEKTYKWTHEPNPADTSQNEEHGV
jgi:hypothetical protein